MAAIVHLLTTVLIAQVSWALIPATPGEQTRRCIKSTKEKIRESSTNNCGPRIYIDYLIPLPVKTTDADIDPWPGGLAQQYKYAEDILKDVLLGIVDESSRENCSSQIVSADDCCGLFIQESPVSPELDVAALLFPSPDQLQNIKEIDKMVGDKRTLIIFNRQFKQAADFGFFNKNKAEGKEVMDKYEFGFAFQEIACRGEDLKLVYEQSIGWQACVIDENGKEIEITDDSWDVQVRPDYEMLEKKINEHPILKEPLWLRLIGEAQEKGLKFTRKE